MSGPLLRVRSINELGVTPEGEEMLLDDFKKKMELIDAGDEAELDALCLTWIETALMDNGKDGKVGIALLDIIRKNLMP